MLAVFGILLSLALLMLLAYRGTSVIVFAPIFALLAASLSGLSPLPTFTEIFLPSLAGYLKVYFPFFLLGAIFGKAMEETGSAQSIARWIAARLGPTRAMLAVVLSGAVLTYGGVSLFVVAFAVYPFAAELFREASIPKRLLPATIALGAFTFTMDALPGTPQIQNTIPMKYFNTDLYAAPVFGGLGALLVLSAGLFYLNRRWLRAQVAGEGYGDYKEEAKTILASQLPHPAVAVIPLISVLGVTLILQRIIFPNWDIASWATQPPYSMDPAGIGGTRNNWALMIGLSVGISLALALNLRVAKTRFSKVINAGALGSLLAVMNTASEVGFGNVVKALPGFQAITQALMGSASGNPLFSEALTVNLLAGITGSASGGLSIALDSFGKVYLEWAERTGISPELLHRVAAMSSGGMDTLPHNGAVITLLAITGLTHRDSYKDIFVITLIKTGTVFALIGAQALLGFK